MIVTIDNNITTYEYGKNCIVKIRKIFVDGSDCYFLQYGQRNSVIPYLSVWNYNLPAYLDRYVSMAFDYIGFDRNFDERDIRGLISSIRNYKKRRSCVK